MQAQMAVEVRSWVGDAVSRFEGQLVRYATRIVGDPDKARDVVQDTFIRLSKQDMDRINGHLAQWLYLCCRNRALDIIRKEKRLVPLDDTLMATRSANVACPATKAGRQDEFRGLMEIVAGLSARQQRLIRMKFLEGRSYREIGEAMGISVSNVGVSLHNAVKKVRAEVKRRHEQPALCA